MVMKSIAQSGIGRYTAGQGHLFDAMIFGRLAKFLHQDVYDRVLKRCAQIGLVLFYEVGIFGQFVAQSIEE